MMILLMKFMFLLIAKKLKKLLFNMAQKLLKDQKKYQEILKKLFLH